jgi:AraC-like DNA-binding protein
LEQIIKYTPSHPLLSKIVSGIVFWRRSADEEGTKIFLPNNVCGFGFTVAGEFHVKTGDNYEKMPEFGTRNTFSKACEIRTKGDFFNISVRLILPNGLCVFTKIPMNNIYNHNAVSLTDIFDKQEVNDIAEQLFRSKTDAQRLSILESYLVSKVTYNCPPLFGQIMMNIHESKGAVNVFQLAKQFQTSERTINRYFNMYIGVNPNSYINLIRIRSVLNLQVNANKNLSEAAFDAGYYDQSHFIKQFKDFTNLTPKQFLKNNSVLSDFYNI